MEHRGLRLGEDTQAPECRSNSQSLANCRDEISGSDRHRRRGAGVRDELAPGRPGRSRPCPAPALSLGARRTGAAAPPWPVLPWRRPGENASPIPSWWRTCSHRTPTSVGPLGPGLRPCHSPCRATRKISTSPWKEIHPDTPCGAICKWSWSPRQTRRVCLPESPASCPRYRLVGICAFRPLAKWHSGRAAFQSSGDAAIGAVRLKQRRGSERPGRERR